MFSWLTPPTPDFSSRGAVKPPEKFVPLPKAPAPAPPRSMASHPPPKVFEPVAAPPPVLRAEARRMAVPVSEPLGFTTGFSPNIETFKSIGEPYFSTGGETPADLSQWATFPAVATVVMDSNNIEGASDIATTRLSATESISAPVLNLLRSGTTPGTINMRDNNGINHTLDSQNGDLYFDNELLAKAGDIQDIADWALYPAIADVAMNGKKLEDSTGANFLLLNNAGSIALTSQTASLALTGHTSLDLNAPGTMSANIAGQLGTAGQVLTSDGAQHVVWADLPDPPDPGVTSVNTVVGAVILEPGAGIIIGPGTGPQDIKIAAPTIGEALDPPGPQTAYGQANQAIADAAAAQATADAIAAAYVTKVGLVGNQRSGEITLVPGANTTITEAPNGTFTFASNPGGGVTSVNTVVGAVILEPGAGIIIGPGTGPQDIKIAAPTLGSSTDPPGPQTAYGQANQAIADAAEALAAAEAAQASADAAAAEAAAAAAEATAAAAAAAAAGLAAGVAQSTATAAGVTATAAATGVAAIAAAYVTKVGLAGNQRSGEITLAAGANTTITEAPDGTFTIASTSTAAGVTSLNALTGAVTLVAGSGISVTPAGSNITIASTGGFDLNGLQNKVGIFPALPLTGDGVKLAANNTGAPATAIVPDATPPTSSTTVLGTLCWLYTKPVSNAGFNWYMYNPRFGAPAAPLPYKKYSNSSVIDRIQSVWALVQPAVNTNIYTAGVVAFNLYSFDVANPPTSGFYNTRWAYSNSQGLNSGASGTNLYAGYTYLLYAYDAPRITNQTGVGQPDIQDWGLRDPYDLYTDVHHIPLQNAVIAFNPWTDTTDYKTWTTTGVFTNGQTVVYSGFGGTANGIFYTVVGLPPVGTTPVSAAGVPSAFFVAIVPQPSSYASQPILAMALTGASGNSAPGWTAGPLLRVLSMGWTAGPDPTTTTVSERYVLN